jgi:NAD(P)-dependent dehydrogenase (short-subunit alcohol dehydrogenase family)
MQLNGIENRVALVTGAARGIGLCIAETLRDMGARTAAGDLEAPAVAGVLGVALDVSDEHSIDRAFDEIERELGAVELLVLNAGIMVSQPFPEVTVDVWRRQLDVNLTGAFLCARRALPAMVDAGSGSIVAVGSSAGKTGGGVAAAAYSASKAGLMTLSKSIAKEYAGHGIRSNAVAPALIDTVMIKDVPDLRGLIPLGRYGTPQEVADVVAFLCSDHASFMTGEVVDVNGGFVIDSEEGFTAQGRGEMRPAPYSVRSAVRPRRSAGRGACAEHPRRFPQAAPGCRRYRRTTPARKPSQR